MLMFFEKKNYRLRLSREVPEKVCHWPDLKIIILDCEVRNHESPGASSAKLQRAQELVEARTFMPNLLRHTRMYGKE